MGSVESDRAAAARVWLVTAWTILVNAIAPWLTVDDHRVVTVAVAPGARRYDPFEIGTFTPGCQSASA
jgi:hypothetical protein